MEFRQLEYFCTISELENFTRTAEVLHVSQPSVTKAIKALEAELGVKLIDRSQKHVSLTEEGQAFLLHAKRIMKDMEIAKKDMMRYRPQTRGTIHFGIPPMIEAYLFPDLFLKFKQYFPDITLAVQEYQDSVEVHEQADISDLDFAIMIVRDDEEVANSFAILHDTMQVCLPKNHRLARRETLMLSDLAEEKFIMQQPNSFQYREIIKACSEAGFMPETAFCTSQLKTLKQLVAKGMGIAILPNFVTRTDTDFVKKPLRPAMDIKVVLYWSGKKVLSLLDRQFMDFIRRYKEMPEFKQRYRQ